MKDRLASVKWGTVLALSTSMAAFGTSAWNNQLIQSDRSIRETPFVIPSVDFSADRFSIGLSNYSEVTARVHSIRMSDGDREVIIDDGNRRDAVMGRSGPLGSFLGHYFLGRFGVDPGAPIGVEADFRIPLYMRVRQDAALLEMGGLENVIERLTDIDADAYTMALMTDLQLEVCSCNIYGDTCLIAGTETQPMQVRQCPQTQP